MSGTTTTSRCSFCGESSGEHMEGGGEDLALPEVRICAGCARAAVDALVTERRIGEARASEPPRRGDATRPGELGTIVEWTPFQMDDLDLEWSATRGIITARTPESVVALRKRATADAAPVVRIHIADDSEPSIALVNEAAVWLAHDAHADQRDAVVRDWAPIIVEGSELEWRIERVPVLRASTAVHVRVRNPATGASTATERGGTVEPTVEDAMMAAASSADVLGGGADSRVVALVEERPDD